MGRALKGRIAAALLAACLLPGVLPASAAGTADDSLVTESYADAWGEAMLDSAVAGIDSAMAAALETGPGGRTFQLSDGDALVLGAGASAVLVSGSARISATGTLVNVTVGSAAESGNLNARQLYVVGGSSSSRITAKGDAGVTVWGEAQLRERTVVFSDVPEGTWYYDYVYAAVSAGVIDGMNSYEYAPESGFTVAQAVKIAACLHQLYYEGAVTLENDPELWYTTFVEYALANGVAGSKYADMSVSEFNEPINRRDFAVLFYNAMPSYEYEAINTVESIPDVAAGSEGAEEIYALYRAGILNGMNLEGNYQPESGIRRNEAAAIVARMLDKDLRVRVTLE